MSIADQVDALERAGDGYRHAIAELTRMNEMLVRDRDQWKSRAEYAERDRDQLNKCVAADRETISKLNARIAELERELIDAMAEVGTLKQCAKMDAAEINLLRQQSKSHGLEAVLEELRAGRIPGRIHVDCYGINVSVFCVGGFRHSESVKSFADITAAIEKLVMMHYPDSAFARRRKPAEPTPNSSETPNSSPSQPDCVEELLVGDLYVSFDRNGVIDISAKGGGIVMSCSASHSTVDFVEGLCQRINRYRRIRDEVGAYVTQAPGHDYPPMECVYRLVKIINGKEAAK